MSSKHCLAEISTTLGFDIGKSVSVIVRNRKLTIILFNVIHDYYYYFRLVSSPILSYTIIFLFSHAQFVLS